MELEIFQERKKISKHDYRESDKNADMSPDRDARTDQEYKEMFLFVSCNISRKKKCFKR